ncbi:MAG: phosphatidate cytidylyltransferase [Proteobacteria bacterium]|nr:phosphatidate cytidylyltransferase [Pseudomonadota bacterium]
MLKQRLITGFTLAALMLAVLLYFPLYGVAIVFGVFAIGSLWEWSHLSGISSVSVRLLYTLTLTAVGIMLYIDIASGSLEIINIALYLAVVWWLYALVVELMINKDQNRGLLKSPYMKLLAGGLIMVPGWASAVYMHSFTPQLEAGLLFIVVVVGMSDTAAFFVGRSLGRHKLAPTVSPGKTIEGFAGGLLFVALTAILFGRLMWAWSWQDVAFLVVISMVAASFGVVGDLVESRIKRLAGAKDSGTLLPGHGGFMDRTDAFFAASPILAVSLIGFGRMTGKW